MKSFFLFSLLKSTKPYPIKLFVVALALFVTSVEADEPASVNSGTDCPESALIILKNGDLELGILPKVGGSAVLFRKAGGENVLFAPCEHWEDWNAHLPDPLDLSQWTAFNGHIVWLSPQVDFWNQQELLPSQHDQLWPPDPYWVYGDFKVIEQSEHHLLLEGPPSPFTGVQMIKRYELDAEGAHLSVTAKNVTDRVLHWGLWSNTRVYGDTKVYVPISAGENESFRIESPHAERIPYVVEDGYFSLATGIEQEANIHSKAYLFPNANWMAGFRHQQTFVKVMQKVDVEDIHPNHGIFEVYQLRPNAAVNDPGLTEMEAHGAYLELQPGDEMTLSERWMIFELNAEAENGKVLSPIKWLQLNREKLDAIHVD